MLDRLITEDFKGEPAADDGDSGGPALLPVLSSGGTTHQLWAGGVISAIRNAPAEGKGAPATSTPPPSGRWRAPTALTADIADPVDDLSVPVLVAPPP